MGNRTVPDLKELFKQASEIARQVPERMQEAAFNRAIDLLTGETSSAPRIERSTAEEKEKRIAASKKSPQKGQEVSLQSLIAQIDSTQHPGVISASKVLDRSLMVLHIALVEHGTDGLTPAEIAVILTEKFRLATTKDAVSMALGRATNLVNRQKDGSGYKYRIMAPGEAYLANIGTSDEAPGAVVKAKRKKKTTVKSAAASEKPSPIAKGAKNNESPRVSTKGGTGPKAAIGDLLASGYFSQGRTAPEVQKHLKSKRGHSFGVAQLRLAMLRLVREGELERDENKERQYEYKQPHS